MPIVTVTMRQGRGAEFKSAVLDAIHRALVAGGAHANDRFHRVLELADEDFRYDPTFPDLETPRTAAFMLIEILLGVGRAVRVKRKILADLADGLKAIAVDPEHVMVVFQDVPWENFSPGGGRIPHG
jgi:phenylpyruvate tautomerase PptA (4-oxalocrotonate tautomerase family)